MSTETRRLARIARAALSAYGIAPARLRLAGASFNSVYHVVAEDGRHLAVRVGPVERIHPEGCEEAEASWLDRLANAGAAVNRALRTPDGAASVVIDDDNGAARPCMVFDWAPGRMLKANVTVPALAAAGSLCAELHEIATANDPATPPHGAPIGDRIVYFAVPDRLWTLRAQYGSLFDDARDRAQATLDRIWHEDRHRAHLLHGDFTPANIVVHRGSVTAIDFQDMLWGLEVQDLAMVIAVLRRSPDHAAQIAAFRSGYERRRTWPDIPPGDMEDLVAVRRLSITNLNVAVGWPNAVATIERHAEMIRAYLSPQYLDEWH